MPGDQCHGPVSYHDVPQVGPLTGAAASAREEARAGAAEVAAALMNRVLELGDAAAAAIGGQHPGLASLAQGGLGCRANQ